MTGKPSQLLKALINTMCIKHADLEGCCSAGTIPGMWREKLPTEVRKQVAGKSIIGKDNMKATLNVADAVHATLQNVAVSALQPVGAGLDDSADLPALQQAAVSAVQRRPPPRRQNRGGGARGGGASGAAAAGARPPPPSRGNPHPDGPPATACNLHWKYGRCAFDCRKRETCPWAHLAPKKNQN